MSHNLWAQLDLQQGSCRPLTQQAQAGMQANRTHFASTQSKNLQIVKDRKALVQQQDGIGQTNNLKMCPPYRGTTNVVIGSLKCIVTDLERKDHDLMHTNNIVFSFTFIMTTLNYYYIFLTYKKDNVYCLPDMYLYFSCLLYMHLQVDKPKKQACL